MKNHANAVPSTSRLPVNLVSVGPSPGALDATQKARILRYSDSVLHFSAFDPLTCGGQDASLNFQRRLNIHEDRPAPKRIVVEVATRTGQSTWRFVPRARKEEGVEDEGVWPRVVDLCGTLAHLCQDQWDIYKLDPFYECLVRKSPCLSTIRPAVSGVRHPFIEPTSLGKRAYDDTSPLSTPTASKRLHIDVTMESIRGTETDDEGRNGGDEEDSDDALDEDLVAEMIGNAHSPQFQPSPAPAPAAGPSHIPSHPMTSTPLPRRRPPPTSPNTLKFHTPKGAPLRRRESRSVPPEPIRKRKEAFGSSVHSDDEEDAHAQGPRRKKVYVRAPSNPPMSNQRELRAKKREEQKRKRREQEQRDRIRQREAELLRDLMNGVPPPQPNYSHPNRGGLDRDYTMQDPSDFEKEEDTESATPSTPTNQSQISEEEAKRAAELEESRRKMQALESDRPLWEQAARERRAREEAEAAAAREKAEARRRKEEERLHQEREFLRRQQEEEELRKRREEEKRDEERAQRAKERKARKERWTSGRWTNVRAVERFKETSDYFDMTRFSEEHPLCVDDVPWPTLRHPDAFSLPEDVDWDSVERFFEVLKGHMRTQEYVTLVEKSHRRFHPDRWRSRGLFRSVLDSEERNWLEVAATTVSQALTPIWQSVRTMKQA